MNTAPPWDTLTIRRFRGLADLRMDQLGTFNLVLGANDVGKTSVLESILLLAAAPNPEPAGGMQFLRGHPVHYIDDLGWLFHNALVDTSIDLASETASGGAYRSLSITAPHTAVIPKPDPEQPPPSSRRALSSTSDKPRLLRYDATVRRRSGSAPVFVAATLVDKGDSFEANVVDTDLDPGDINRIPIPATFVTADAGYESDVISEVVVAKNADRLIRYLRLVNPRVRQITVVDKIAYVDIGLERMLPLNMFGRGMVRTAQLMAVCIAKAHRILLVDEIENGLHYKAIPSLLEALLSLSREENVQVFATTHRLGTLEGLQQVLSRDEFADHRDSTKCFALQRDRDDLVRAYRYDYSQFDHCIRQGIEIR